MTTNDAALDAITCAVVVAQPQGRVTYANSAARRLLGWTDTDVASADLTNLPIAFDGHQGVAATLASGSELVNIPVTLGDGDEKRWLRCNLRHQTAAHSAVVLSLDDVTNEHIKEAQLTWEVQHDYLTDLRNSRGFTMELGRLTAQAAQSGGRLATILVSISGFMLTNDSAEDERRGWQLPRELGRRIEAAIPAGVVARIGLVDFGIVLPLESTSDAMVDAEVDSTVKRMARCVAEPDHDEPHDDDCDRQRLQLNLRIGVAVSDGGSTTVGSQMRDATIALNRSHAGVGGQYAMFEQRFLTDLRRSQRIEHELRRALRRDPGQVSVVYQTMVRLSDRQPVAVEALARWHHPELGCVAPDVFIRVAEQTDLIAEVGRHIRRCAIEELATRPDLAGLTLGLNVSRRELSDPSIVESVAADVRDAGLAPGQVCIELTERAFGNPDASPVEIVGAFRSRGFLVAMDDLGTGVSALSQLVSLPLSGVKIPKPFIEALGVRDGAEPVLASIVAIAHASGLEVVAEGVETEYQHWAIQAAGVDIGQGFYYAKPASIAEVGARLPS